MSWDCQVIILIEYMPQGKTINSARYCETIKKIGECDSEEEERHADKGSPPAAGQCHEGTASLVYGGSPEPSLT